MKKLSKFAIACLILVGALALSVLLIVLRPQAAKEVPDPFLPAIEVVKLQREVFVPKIPTQGVIEPITQTRAAAEVPGKVIWVSPRFEAGEPFERGDELLKIDPTDYEAAVALAHATLAEARLALATEEARAAQSIRDWNKLGSDREPSKLVTRELHLASASARIRSAEATLAKAQEDLNRTTLTAPYNGRIKSTATDIGSYAAPGSMLAELYETDTLEIRLPVSLDDFGFVERLDNDATTRPRVELETNIANRKYDWDAEVIRTEAQTDRASRSVFLVANINTAELAAKYPNVAIDLLAPGLFVNGKVFGEPIQNVYSLPRLSLYGDVVGNRGTVLTVEKNDNDENVVRFRPVEILRAEGSRIIISPEGLPEGTQVCITALESAVDGVTQVQILDEEAPAAEGKVADRDGDDAAARP